MEKPTQTAAFCLTFLERALLDLGKRTMNLIFPNAEGGSRFQKSETYLLPAHARLLQCPTVLPCHSPSTSSSTARPVLIVPRSDG
jgi:hypothetical protein